MRCGDETASDATRLADRLALPVLALMFLSGMGSFCDPDMFHGLALARLIVQRGHVPLIDEFAYTPTKVPVVDHEWAEATLVYETLRAGGAPGFMALKLALAMAILVGALAMARRKGAATFTLTPLAPLGLVLLLRGTSTIRAQMFTLLFCTIELHLLESDRRGGRWWMLPYLVMHVAWLNCHGGFVVGAGLLALYAVEQWIAGKPVIHLLLLAIPVVGLVAVNPYGLAYYTYLASALTMDRSLVTEWAPIWRSQVAVQIVFLLSLVIWLRAMAALRGRFPDGWLLLIGSALAAVMHQRHASIYAVVWLSYAAALVQRTPLAKVFDRLWGWRPGVTTAVLTLVGCLAVARAVDHRVWKPQVPTGDGAVGYPVVYPVGPVAYLARDHVAANVMVPFEVGAYVSWRLYPAVKVSVDGRYEVAYAPELIAEHVAFYDATAGWEAMLTRYPTDLVLVPKQRPVAKALRSLGSWTLVYEDDSYLLFARPGLDLPHVDRRGEKLIGTFP